jgi:transcriptional regulator with XRE-family HTH domain
MSNCIERMQEHLSILRKSLGWSGADLGKHLDVTRQMISSLETKANHMTKIQYLAICKVVEDEIRDKIEWSGNDHELYLTQVILEYFIKSDEYLFDSEEDERKVKTLVDIYSEAAFTFAKIKAINRDEVHKEFQQALNNIWCIQSSCLS